MLIFTNVATCTYMYKNRHPQATSHTFRPNKPIIYKLDHACNDIVDISHENVLKLLIHYNSI